VTKALVFAIALALAPLALAGGAVFGTPGPDTLLGTAGADALVGLAGNDELYGGAGDDYLGGGPGADHLYGGDGDDRLVGGPWGDAPSPARVLHRERLLGGAGDDVLVSHVPGAVLIGGPGNARIDARDRRRRLGQPRVGPKGDEGFVLAGDGDDRIHSRDGKTDYVQCGTGIDDALVDAVDRTDGFCERLRR